MSESWLLLGSAHLRALSGSPRWIEAESALPDPDRPLALDLYADTVLASQLKRELQGAGAPHDRLVLLGNALGISCRSEWDRLVANVSLPWLLAPGPSDGHALGTGTLPATEWKAACGAAGDAPLPKDSLVLAYLEHLGAQGLGLPRQFGRSGPWQSLDASGVVLGLDWQANEEAPWRSYIVQWLDWTRRPAEGEPPAALRVRAILLDTAQYDSSHGPMSGGHMRADQIASVSAWLEKRGPDGVTFLLGHHPVESLSDDAGDAVKSWIDRGLASLYISSRESAQGFEEHEGALRRWIELGVGSVIDWPISQRSLAVRGTSDSTVSLSYRRIGPPLGWGTPALASAEAEGCNPDWQEDPENRDAFRSYGSIFEESRERAPSRLIDVVLRHEARVRADFVAEPDEPLIERIRNTAGSFRRLESKVKLLSELAASPMVPSNPERWARFQRCNAEWASSRQRSLLGVPDPDESILQLPVRRTR